MIGKKLAAGAVALGLLTGAANAATYSITSILDGVDSGFGYSVFHDQSSWRMSGGEIEDPDATGMAPGAWDSTTGAISFASNLQGSGSISATGFLNLNPGLTSGSLTGVSGYLDIIFTGAVNIADNSYRFIFDDWLMGGSGAPNSYDSANNWISLWGDLGNYTMRGCNPRYKRGGQGSRDTCIGVDLRLQLEPGVVPLPAGLVLLLTGVGGFAGMRKLRKKSS